MITGKSQSQRRVARPLDVEEGRERRADLWMQGKVISSLETGKEEEEMSVEKDPFVELVVRKQGSHFLWEGRAASWE